ncbi:FecR family protein [Sphingobacterium sp. SYP-B4668]|uniref:FecR family protein n=1 Tax=Sphingobacterium sp. SYP-B4668 TaxID=2996035 RepID=UPI0022DDA371|nr:FecR domain-containing protein [Sphingobacterium sp. SYP-B4668]
MEDKSKAYGLALIYDSLSGNTDPASEEALEKWLSESDENRTLYAQAREIHVAMEYAEPDTSFDASLAYSGFLDRKNKHTSRNVFKRKAWRYVAVAAGLLLAFTTGSYWSAQEPHTSNQQIATVVVAKGSKSRTVLQDGTIVWLNSDSKLEVADKFGQGERKIKLVGEAFLQVAHDSNRPFIVEANTLAIKVHGTSFNVSCYPEQPDVTVSLVEGSVELVTKDGKKMMMQPNQTFAYNSRSNSYQQIHGIQEQELAWRDAKLIFKNKRFSEIVIELERMFDIQIEVNRKEVLNRRFTGDFVNNEGITEVMEVMSSLGKFSYEVNGRTVHIF